MFGMDPHNIEPDSQSSVYHLVSHSGGFIRGEIGQQRSISLPGDKSISHRAALLAGMGNGESRISNFLLSGVTRPMLNALTALGIEWEYEHGLLTVQGGGIDGFNPPEETLNCGNSATTMRLLCGAITASGVEATIDGSGGLRRRPMDRITRPLRQMGVDIEDTGGCAPLVLFPAKQALNAVDYILPVASAQVKTCLLLAALSADGVTVLREPGPSRDHTERMLGSMGVNVLRNIPGKKKPHDLPQLDGYYVTQITPPVPRRLNPLKLKIPGDVSAASFLIVAGLIVPDSELLIHGVGLNPTRTGLIQMLQKMGADIQVETLTESHGEPVGDLIIKSSELYGTTVSGSLVVRMIDEFPIFAIAAACARGKTIVQEAVELRHKESDRITALCGELRKVGVSVSEEADGFEIKGGVPIKGGIIDPHGDHRLAMSLAIAGLVSQEPVVVEHAEIIGESFPDFTVLLQHLGANVELRLRSE